MEGVKRGRRHGVAAPLIWLDLSPGPSLIPQRDDVGIPSASFRRKPSLTSQKLTFFVLFGRVASVARADLSPGVKNEVSYGIRYRCVGSRQQPKKLDQRWLVYIDTDGEALAIESCLYNKKKETTTDNGHNEQKPTVKLLFPRRWRHAQRRKWWFLLSGGYFSSVRLLPVRPLVQVRLRYHARFFFCRRERKLHA